MAKGEVNPDNHCLACDLSHPLQWSPMPDGSICGNAANKCETSSCKAGSCSTKKVECADDGCHTAGMCDASSGTCVYAETMTKCANGDKCCPTGCTFANDDFCPAAAVCGNGILEAGEACDGTQGCKEGESCSASCLCLPKKQKLEAAGTPTVVPEITSVMSVNAYCLDASAETEQANAELKKIPGMENAIFCDADTAVACMAFSLPISAGQNKTKGLESSSRWNLTQERGRTFAGVDVAHAIEAPSIIAASAANSPAQALSNASSSLTTEIANAAVIPDTSVQNRWLINGNITIDRMLLSDQSRDFQPAFAKHAFTLPAKAATSDAAPKEYMTSIVCFTPIHPPTWAGAGDADNPNDVVYDVPKILERFKGQSSGAGLGNTAGIWNPSDIYRFSLTEGNGSQGAAKDASGGVPIGTIGSGIVYARPGLNVGSTSRCSLTPQAIFDGESSAFDFALLSVPGFLLLFLRARMKKISSRGRW